MTPEPPTPTPRRKRRFLRWLGVLLLGYFAYAAWKEYDYRAAVKEAEALGWEVYKDVPPRGTKRDRFANIRMETWTQTHCSLLIYSLQSFIGHESLLVRLNPQDIFILTCPGPLNLSALKDLPALRVLMIHDFPEMTDANMDQIQELTNLKELAVTGWPRLTRLNPLIELKKLEYLGLDGVPLIPQKDIDAFKAAHPGTKVDITR